MNHSIPVFSSLLASPTKGMGLERGVPKNTIEGKDSSNFDKELDRSDAMEQTSHIKDELKVKEDAKPKEKAVKDISQKEPLQAQVEDSVDTAPQQAVVPVLETAPTPATDVVGESLVMEAQIEVAISAPMQNLQNHLPNLPNLQKPGGEVIKNTAEKGESIDEMSNDSPSEIPLSELFMNSEASENAESRLDLSRNSIGALKEPAGPKDSLKGFSDKLWIGQQVDGFQIALGNEKGAEPVTLAASESQSPETIRHLTEDMKPLVTKVVTQQEGGEMIVNLRPAHLGSVKVQVQVSGDHVRLAIAAEQPQTKQILQSQMGELRNQFSQQGMKLEEVSVIVQSNALSRESQLSHEDRRSSPEDHRNQRDDSQKREQFSHQKHKNFRDERAFDDERSAWA